MSEKNYKFNQENFFSADGIIQWIRSFVSELSGNIRMLIDVLTRIGEKISPQIREKVPAGEDPDRNTFFPIPGISGEKVPGNSDGALPEEKRSTSLYEQAVRTLENKEISRNGENMELYQISSLLEKASGMTMEPGTASSRSASREDQKSYSPSDSMEKKIDESLKVLNGILTCCENLKQTVNEGMTI